jgi:hypothetical protein
VFSLSLSLFSPLSQLQLVADHVSFDFVLPRPALPIAFSDAARTAAMAGFGINTAGWDSHGRLFFPVRFELRQIEPRNVETGKTLTTPEYPTASAPIAAAADSRLRIADRSSQQTAARKAAAVKSEMDNSKSTMDTHLNRTSTFSRRCPESSAPFFRSPTRAEFSVTFFFFFEFAQQVRFEKLDTRVDQTLPHLYSTF